MGLQVIRDRTILRMELKLVENGCTVATMPYEAAVSHMPGAEEFWGAHDALLRRYDELATEIDAGRLIVKDGALMVVEAPAAPGTNGAAPEGSLPEAGADSPGDAAVQNAVAQVTAGGVPAPS